MTIPTARILIALLAMALILGSASAEDRGGIRVHLIGTGGPELTPTRLGMSTLIEAEGETLIFDVGRGALQNIYLSRIDPRSVTRIFLTHLHSDHIEGLPSLWLTPWFMFGRRKQLEIWGPQGTRQMIEGMRMMYGHDLDHRANAVFKRESLDIAVHVIVSNVVAFSEPMTKAAVLKPVLDKLTTPEQAAAIFSSAKPRLAVYSHIVKKELPGDAGDDVVIRRTRAAGYDGPLVMGKDRMIVDVGDEVKVLPPPDIEGIVDFDKPDSKF